MLSTKSYGNNSNSAAMRPKTAPLNLQPKVQIDKESTLLNERVWRDKVRLEKAQNDQAMVKSDVHIFVSKREDPLTNLREVLRDLSNAEAFKYMKQCRLMVARLKKCWFDTNEEIKSLTRTKEYLESSIEHIRKDLIINKAIVDLRTNRAQNEPNEDKVDDALEVEKQNLFYLKKSLEAILKPVQEQLYILDEVRERISKLEKERSVVTELICQCLTQSTRNFERAVSRQKAVAAPKLYRSKTTISSSLSSFAAAGNDVDPSSVNNIGPLSAFTAESVDILNESQAKIDLGRDLRIKSRLLIKECIDNAKNIGHIVNDSFVKKIEETLYLSKKLNLSSAENKLAQNRAIRWQDLNTVAMKYTLGPEKSTNLMISEQLDRPIIKTFQKHPGNQLPEAQEIIKGSEALEKSIIKSENHIKKLKIIGTKLDSSARDKELQHSIDSALLRRRREMADHRWVAEKYVK